MEWTDLVAKPVLDFPGFWRQLLKLRAYDVPSVIHQSLMLSIGLTATSCAINTYHEFYRVSPGIATFVCSLLLTVTNTIIWELFIILRLALYLFVFGLVNRSIYRLRIERVFAGLLVVSSVPQWICNSTATMSTFGTAVTSTMLPTLLFFLICHLSLFRLLKDTRLLGEDILGRSLVTFAFTGLPLLWCAPFCLQLWAAGYHFIDRIFG